MFLLQIPNNHGAAGNTAFTFTLSGSFLWFCSRDALHLNNCMASRMLLPDPSIHTEKSAGSHMLTKTDTHICIIHTHNLSRTYMPTAVCSGRVTEPVAMTETYLFKLEPWDTTISVGLHSRTTPFSTSHTLSQTQLHWANPPPAPQPILTKQPESLPTFFTLSKPLCSLLSSLISPLFLSQSSIWPQDLTRALDGVETAPGLKSLRRVIPQEQHPLSDEDPNVSYSASPLLNAY